MYVQRLDTDDPTRLEAQLEAQPHGTLARVANDLGTFLVRRVPGGWHMEGDVTVTSGDVADGRPGRVWVLRREDYRGSDEEGLALLADVDPGEADDLRAWAETQRGEYAAPDEVFGWARAALAARDRGAAEALAAELDDLHAVGWDEAGPLRDALAELTEEGR